MDDKILELLQEMKTDMKTMQESISRIETKVTKLEEGQIRIESKLESVVEQTKDLTEFRTETKQNFEDLRSDMSNVEVITASNWKDIAKIKAAM